MTSELDRDGIDRRTFLRVGTLGSALSLANVSSLSAATNDKIKSVVIFMQAGAQSPYEFVSPLTDSPVELRGPFGHMRARNGMPINEKWTRTADVLDQATVVRSLNCENSSHTTRPIFHERLATYGSELTDGGIPYIFEHVPSTFSIHNSMKSDTAMELRWNKKRQEYLPPKIERDPRFLERTKLLRSIDTLGTTSASVERFEETHALAESLLLGKGKLTEPFKQSRDRWEQHGDNPIGKATALATEFAISGAGITVVYNEMNGDSGVGWDMHNNIKQRSDELIPPTDQALAALIEDARRHDFVVLCISEHGRTPRINQGAGRDHYPVGYMIGAGGRFHEGLVYGSVNKRGDIKEGEVAAAQVMPTVLAAAGVDVPLPNNVLRPVLKTRT